MALEVYALQRNDKGHFCNAFHWRVAEYIHINLGEVWHVIDTQEALIEANFSVFLQWTLAYPTYMHASRARFHECFDSVTMVNTLRRFIECPNVAYFLIGGITKIALINQALQLHSIYKKFMLILITLWIYLKYNSQLHPVSHLINQALPLKHLQEVLLYFGHPVKVHYLKTNAQQHPVSHLIISQPCFQMHSIH